MSREIRRVDRVVLSWMLETGDPAGLLEDLERRFRDRSPRSGYILGGTQIDKRYEARTGKVDHLVLLDMGMLTGMLSVGEADRSFTWSSGDLVLKTNAIPESIVEGLPGRRLGDVISHGWVPEGTVIQNVERKGTILTLACQEFSMSIEDAKEAIRTDAGRRRD